MKDDDITGTLEFTKLDFSNDNPLPNTLIEIYNDGLGITALYYLLLSMFIYIRWGHFLNKF